MEQKTPFWVAFFSGGIAGTVGAVITCPLEVVKTRLQSAQYSPIATTSSITYNGTSLLIRPIRTAASSITSTLTIVRSLATNEGVGALWKGVGATVIGVIPARSIYFSSYHKGKHMIAEVSGRKESDPLVHLAAAGMAGMATCTVTNPIWMVKTRMQLQGKRQVYLSSVDCLKRIVREEGVGGLYKGLAASYIGVAESTLQWVIYENLKARIATSRAHKHQEPLWIEYFGAAAGAKFVAAVVAYPHEVIRTRMREACKGGPNKYLTVKQTVQTILREEGGYALYSGMTAHLMRVVPNSAIMFFCYEFLVHSYSRLVQ